LFLPWISSLPYSNDTQAVVVTLEFAGLEVITQSNEAGFVPRENRRRHADPGRPALSAQQKTVYYPAAQIHEAM
jgi:hypothetical protein